MSTAVLPAPTRRSAAPPVGAVTLPRVLTSEWVKLRSLRSTWATLVATVAAFLAFGAVVAVPTRNGTADGADDAALSGTLQGYLLAELLVGVLGVLFVSSEYGTGMIRSTLAAVPRRTPVLVAKAAVVGGVVLVVTAAAALVTFLGAQLVLGPQGHSLGDPTALRVVLGTPVYLALVALLGTALGWLLRTTAAGIAVLTGLLLVVPVLAQTILGELGRDIAPYLPSLAGQSFITSEPAPGALGPVAGLAVLAGTVAVALAVAAIRLRRADA